MMKYLRQIAAARKMIAAKGTIVTWYKAGQADVTDPTPEFPELADAVGYDVPFVLYPITNLRDGSITYDKDLQTGVQALYGAMPGDVPFTPEDGDAVLLPGNNLVHVNYINITQPDGVPIVFEVGFK